MQAQPLGVFDSGVGGLTVVRAIRRALPAESLEYLGDTARLPYGSKSPETVARYSLACARFLLGRGVKLLVVACNTASAHALGPLRAAFSVPVIGAVEPGAKSALAATRSGRVGVLGTLGTIRSGAYEAALAALDAGVRVSVHACPMLVPLAEEGWTDDEITRAIARRYLGELAAKDPAIDTIVLGCTHYPILAPVLERVAAEVFGRELRLVDSATAMAAEVAAVLAATGGATQAGGTGRLACHVTDASRIDELAPRFLGEPLAAHDLVELAL